MSLLKQLDNVIEIWHITLYYMFWEHTQSELGRTTSDEVPTLGGSKARGC